MRADDGCFFLPHSVSDRSREKFERYSELDDASKIASSNTSFRAIPVF